MRNPTRPHVSKDAKRRSRLLVQRLEDRTVPATIGWVGDVSGLWNANVGGNTNWANLTTLTDNVLPHNGDDLVFSTMTLNHTQTNNITNLNPGSISFSDTDYLISGNAITVDTITDTSSSGHNTLNLPIAGPITVAVNAASTRLTLGGAISGSGASTKNGNGILRLSGASANTYTGLTTVSDGTLELNKSANVLAAPGNLTINSGGTVRELAANQIANTSAVTVNTGGAFDLNSFSDTIGFLHVLGGVTIGLGALTAGPVNVDGGSVASTGAGKLLLAGNVNANAALFDCNLDLNGTSRAITVNDGPDDIDLDITQQIMGNGSAGLNKLGAGTLCLEGSASNTYTGETFVSFGTLELNKSGGAVAVAGDLTISNGSIDSTVKELANNQIADTSTVSVNNLGTFNLNGQTDTISGLDVIGGNVTIGAGTFVAGPVTMSGGSIASTGSGSLLLLGNVSTIDASSTTATISGNLNLGNAIRNLSVIDGVSAADLDISAVISSGGLTKNGTGTLLLSGAQSNTYTGATTMSGGSLQLSKTNGAVAVAGNLTVNAGGLVELFNNQIADASAVTVNGGQFTLSQVSDTIGALSVAGGTVDIIANTLSAGPVTMMGGSITGTMGGTLRLQGNVITNQASSAATITANLDLGGATRTFNVADGGAASDLDILGVISGSGSEGLTKTGAGTLRLSGIAANTFTGLTTVSAGTLTLSRNGVLAVAGNLTINGGTAREVFGSQIANASAVSVTNGGLLDLNNLSDTIGPLTIDGSVISSTGVTIGTGTLTAGPVNLIGGSISSTGAGKLVLQGDMISSGTSATATISGNLDLNGATRTFNVADGPAGIDLDILALISGSAGAGLTKTGTGNLSLGGSASNTYTGTTTVFGGTLEMGRAGGAVAVPGNLVTGSSTVRLLAANQIADTATVTVSSGGSFDLFSQIDTIGPLILMSNTASVFIGAGTLTAGTVTMTGGLITSFTGGSLVLQGNVTTNASASVAAISANINLGGLTRTFTVNDGSATPDVDISAVVQNGGLNKAGSGILQLSGSSSNTYADLTTVFNGTLELNKTGGAIAVAGNFATGAIGALARELFNNQIADTAFVTVNPISTFHLNGQTDVVGVVTVSGTLNTSGATAGRLTAGNTTFDSTADLFMRLVDVSTSDRITVNGTLTVGGTLSLNPTQALPIGAAITLIENDGADPVTGTFTLLPQGATFFSGGQLFAISYTGGTGNDVVVTRTGGPTVLSARVNDGSAQRSRVTSVTVTFSAQVTFAGNPPAAFTLTRNGGSSVSFAMSITVLNGVTVVTLNNFNGLETEFGTLKDGRYTLTVLANQITFGGQQLDGNGDGAAGDNFTFGESQGLFRFYGDINGDRHVDIADFALFSSAFNLSTGQTGFLAAFDFNGDGHIDIADFGQFSIRFFTPLP